MQKPVVGRQLSKDQKIEVLEIFRDLAQLAGQAREINAQLEAKNAKLLAILNGFCQKYSIDQQVTQFNVSTCLFEPRVAQQAAAAPVSRGPRQKKA